VILIITTSVIDVVANHGEDLRFPISSSSGFSSPFAFFPSLKELGGPCNGSLQGIFFAWICYMSLYNSLQAYAFRGQAASRFPQYAQVRVLPGFLFPLESPPREQLAKNQIATASFNRAFC
jgi:hypothetical protein